MPFTIASRISPASSCLVALLCLVVAAPSFAAPGDNARARHGQVIKHWTPERIQAAIPRDLVIDERGKGYIRMRHGTLLPHGHRTPAESPVARAKPGGSGDTTPPSFGVLSPNGIAVAQPVNFSAQIQDASGIRSATLYLQGSGSNYSFSLQKLGDENGYEVWGTSLSGSAFTDGSSWSWYVTAKDRGARGGNTGTSTTANFTISSDGGGSGGGGSGDVIQNDPWTASGVVQNAAGRIYFEMPDNRKRRRWSGYVCSGTVVADGETDGRSVILTAAHCVYDDVNKAFARNVLFIPNQAGTTGSRTDGDCSNDPLGCWTPAFGVVDANWTLPGNEFPGNVEWDYAYYVVSDSGAHSGASAGSDALDVAVQPMNVSFATPSAYEGDASLSHALGYSYSDDPNFMYCAEAMTTEGTANWWLSQCELGGGSSGGPWVQPMHIGVDDPNTAEVEENGNGPIISVNSWGYTTAPGMAGPMLDAGSSASCLLDESVTVPFAGVPASAGDAGLVVDADGC